MGGGGGRAWWFFDRPLRGDWLVWLSAISGLTQSIAQVTRKGSLFDDAGGLFLGAAPCGFLVGSLRNLVRGYREAQGPGTRA